MSLSREAEPTHAEVDCEQFERPATCLSRLSTWRQRHKLIERAGKALNEPRILLDWASTVAGLEGWYVADDRSDVDGAGGVAHSVDGLSQF